MKGQTLKLWKGNTMLIALSAFLMCLSSVSQTMAQESGENYTIDLPGKIKLEMIWIEPGTFKMGSPENELGRWDDEVQHEVKISKEFWLGKYEVTQAQWNAVMGSNDSEFKGKTLPVTDVSWEKVMKFCEELTKMEKKAGNLPEGYKYTLPTEAQWEYACRAGTRTSLNNGENITTAAGTGKCPNLDKVEWYSEKWYAENSEDTPHPVGKKQPNEWGLYDMHGNVCEWCLDWYIANLGTNAVTDPMGPSLGLGRVMRGGRWSGCAYSCRSANRIIGAPSRGYSDYGFRVVLSQNTSVKTVDIKEGKNYTLPLSETAKLDMIWIEPDTFTMGSSPEDELDRHKDEIQHQVTLTRGYWLCKYEVTQAQYESIMGTNPSKFKGADLPVDSVCWNEAKEFCAKLNAQEKVVGRLPEGYEYNLPTEAQWEYACRAGTTSSLNSGKNLSDTKQCPEMDEVGWYWYNSDKTTHPVGQKQPNAWGLYDMHGNVWEWCLDWYGSYPSSAVTDPKGPAPDWERVIRGGSWRDDATHCRSALRYNYYPRDHSIGSFGFRVALSLVQ